MRHETRGPGVACQVLRLSTGSREWGGESETLKNSLGTLCILCNCKTYLRSVEANIWNLYLTLYDMYGMLIGDANS